MKTTLPIFIFLFCSLFTFAQNDVTLNIFHKLGSENFATFQEANNNINNTFDVKRLEYYISEISILHDNGLSTAIEDLHILVDANEATSVELGNYNITEVEGIQFHIGVEEAANHLDPAALPSTDPLSPQIPSMHWGWASGYRFVAMEGSASASLNVAYEIHALGDQNYFMTEVAVVTAAENGQININLDADYTRALEDIEVNPGLINHGFDEEALTLLENFRDYVFTASILSTSHDLSAINGFEVYPNPARNGNSTVKLSVKTKGDYQVTVQNIFGQTIATAQVSDLESTLPLNLKDDGIYFISLIQNGNVLITEKLLRLGN